MERQRRRDLLILFFSLFLIYNANLRPISAGDSAPARLIPFSILWEGDLDLDEFDFTAFQRDPSSLPYFVLKTHVHVMSLYPCLTDKSDGGDFPGGQFVPYLSLAYLGKGNRWKIPHGCIVSW